MYAADRQTDGQKQRLLPLPYGRGHNNAEVACVDQFVPARQELWMQFKFKQFELS